MLRFVERPVTGRAFERPDDMSEVLYALLLRRGICTADEAQAFLHPGEEQLNDPMLLSDMSAAVERIRLAAQRGERVCVWGDYDADGVCSSAIMHLSLLEAGIDAEAYIPSRHSEGYGLNDEGIRAVAERADLLITVDCGISCKPQVELAESLELECIVTDHHRPGNNVPNCLVVNPLLNDYPFPWLCGAGIAFRLAEALNGRESAMKLVDIAAIATVADIVSLTGENRAIVTLGLQRLNSAPRPGISELLRAAGIENRTLVSEDIAFRIAPRLNAAGRLGDARRAYDLLIEQDDFLAAAQADELNRENALRQELSKKICEESEAQLKQFDFSAHRILMVRGTGWNKGVIGLAAGHLCQTYSYPVAVFAEEDGFLSGSCRSIPGIDIFDALRSADRLMVKYGGHAQAAGLTIRAEDFDELQRMLDSHIASTAAPECYLPRDEYDLTLPVSAFTLDLIEELAKLEPTGCENPAPVFRTEGNVIDPKLIGAQRNHLSLSLSDGGQRLRAIYFNTGIQPDALASRAELLCYPTPDTFRGVTNVQLRLSAIKNPNIPARIDAFKSEKCISERSFLTDLFYNKRISNFPVPSAISVPELKKLLETALQGTMILCGDTENAAALYEQLGVPLDLYIGEEPPDPRLFNALWLYPVFKNSFPKALRRIVLCGCPLPAGIGEDVEVLTLNADSPIWKEIPGVDEMRDAFKQTLMLTKNNIRPSSRADLLRRLSAASGQSETMLQLSLIVLEDLELILIRERPFSVTVPPAKKTSPETSEIWRMMQSMRK